MSKNAFHVFHFRPSLRASFRTCSIDPWTSHGRHWRRAFNIDAATRIEGWRPSCQCHFRAEVESQTLDKESPKIYTLGIVTYICIYIYNYNYNYIYFMYTRVSFLWEDKLKWLMHSLKGQVEPTRCCCGQHLACSEQSRTDRPVMCESQLVQATILMQWCASKSMPVVTAVRCPKRNSGETDLFGTWWCLSPTNCFDSNHSNVDVG